MKKENLPNNKRGSELESLFHSEQTVTVDKLVVGGNGLARIIFQDKPVVVFIPLSAPGDILKIKIVRVEKNHLYGEILEILKASASRQQPQCEYFAACGGCSWQHINESEQLKQKEQILIDLLNKNVPNISFSLQPSVASEKNYHYRNRIQLKQSGTELGYFKRMSHQIVDINFCKIADLGISDQIPVVKSKLRPSQEVKKFELRLNQLNQFEYYTIGNDGEDLSFSQVNNEVNSRLVSEVVRLVKGVNPKFITELYAGAGNFSFPLLSDRPDLRVESVEMNPKLTVFSTKKLTELKLQKRLFAFTSDCESFVERRPLSHDLVLLDPPRSGCSERVLNKIIAANPQNLLYISCHPAFLARDLKKIIDSHPDYTITYLQIFDMFPQTDHFETLVLLSKQPVNN